MLTELRVQNFRRLVDVKTSLSPFTVFVGPNSVGKSSILEAIDLLFDAARNTVTKAITVPVVERARARGTTGPIEIEAKGKFPAESAQWLLHIEGDDVPFDATINATLLMGPNSQKLFEEKTRVFTDPGDSSKLLALRRHRLAVPHVIAYRARFDFNMLVKPAEPVGEVPQILPDGKGLGPVLEYLALTESARFDAIQDSLRKIVPSFKRIRFVRERVRFEEWVLEDDAYIKSYRDSWVNNPVFDFTTATGLPANAVSEGTLISLAVLAALSSQSGACILLLDDIERGLHPQALGEFVQQLRRLQAARGETQILASSHSPYMLDHIAPEEVRVIHANEIGNPIVAALGDHPEFLRWNAVMKPGEFWSTVGESWVSETDTGGRTAT